MSDELTNQFQNEAIRLRELHVSMIAHARKIGAEAIEAGDTLMRVKAGLDHGEWLPWLKANVQFSARTAEKYMRCYERRDELKAKFESDSNFSLSDAYALIEGTGQRAVHVIVEKEQRREPVVVDVKIEPLPGESEQEWHERRIIEQEKESLRREEIRLHNLPIEVERALQSQLNEVRDYKGKKQPRERVTKLAKTLIRFGKQFVTQGERLLRETEKRRASQ